ncbi:hypothetical protein GGX14DRAFT_400467 [Mycena pura]|uniref:Uncharacterized protein n=1 Tax=Mycena pura TaxID=153505 RepID=A0AAD6Y9K2_9AGAR|nr:hypothetical protein GGX14DRAFT_400467 [Mycena pura]
MTIFETPPLQFSHSGCNKELSPKLSCSATLGLSLGREHRWSWASSQTRLSVVTAYILPLPISCRLSGCPHRPDLSTGIRWANDRRHVSHLPPISAPPACCPPPAACPPPTAAHPSSCLPLPVPAAYRTGRAWQEVVGAGYGRREGAAAAGGRRWAVGGGGWAGQWRARGWDGCPRVAADGRGSGGRRRWAGAAAAGAAAAGTKVVGGSGDGGGRGGGCGGGRAAAAAAHTVVSMH